MFKTLNTERFDLQKNLNKDFPVLAADAGAGRWVKEKRVRFLEQQVQVLPPK